MKIKTLQTFFSIAVLVAVSGNLFGSEASDLFERTVPKMSSENQDERKAAQQDWMNHCLRSSNDPALRAEANQLMLAQLEKYPPVDTAVWLIRQLGYIGEAQTAAGLEKCLSHEEKRIADEAARALADLETPEAEAVLAKTKSRLSTSARHEIQPDRNILLKNENETQMPAAIPYASAEAVAGWMKNYDELDDFQKARTLANLARRRDGKYIQQALQGVKSENEMLRDAAITALGAFGSSREIPVLLEQMYEGGNRDLAKTALIRMNDRTLDVQLLGRLESEKNPGRFEQIADIFRNRNNTAALPVLLNRAKSPDCPNRRELLQIAESLSSKEKIGDFIDVWELVADRGQKDQVEQVIARLVAGDSTPVIAKRNEKNYADMFSLLGRIGDEKSLEEIRARVFGKTLPSGMSQKPELTAAALRAMCNWPDARVAKDLIAVVESRDFSAPERISALRGYIRVVSLPNDRIGIRVREKDKVEMLGKAMELSNRLDEKRLVIQRAGQVRDVESLKLILKFFDDAELQGQVCASIVDLAHHTDLRNSAKEDFAAALDRILKTSKDQNLLDRAKRYRDAM